MYNNEVTYHDKWNTPENKAAQDKLAKKYFVMSNYSNHCPPAWAPEVLAFLEKLDAELGFFRRDSTMTSAAFVGNPFLLMVSKPFNAFVTSFRYNFSKEGPSDWRMDRNPDGSRPKKTLANRILSVIRDTAHVIVLCFTHLVKIHINTYVNKWNRPKIHLTQVKEKYGTLRFTYTADPAYNDYIEKQLLICIVQLAAKGAYSPIEDLWNMTFEKSMNTDYDPDTISVEQKFDGTCRVKTTVFRRLMKEMGLDIRSIAASAAKKSEDDLKKQHD